MKNTIGAFALAGLLAAVLPAQRPWQQITVPSVREAAANFKTPPREYGAIQPFMGWNGPDAKERMARIVQDLDRLAANGVFVVNMSPGRGEPKYLSPEHMNQVKFVVQEAAKRGMKLWIQDECDYPSGFAGGKVSEQYPQLTMQGLDADIRINVMPGQTLTMPAPPDTLGALAVFAQTGAVADRADRPRRNQVEGPRAAARRRRLPETVGADPGPAHLPQFSDPHFNRADGTRAKDSQYSLIDYLNPDATRAFLKITHETYKQAVGDEFGKTVLGFFGDEPDYTGFMPWTPKLLDEFRQQKGYDLQPYLPLSVRAQDDRRSLARQGGLLGRVERDVPRDLLRRAGGVVREEQRGVPGPPEPRRAGAAAGRARGPDPQRGRLLPRHAARAGAGHRQPEPACAQRGPHAGRDVGREQQLPQAGLFGGAPVRQAQGLDRIRRRTGHRRQVPVGLSTGARRQRHADPAFP